MSALGFSRSAQAGLQVALWRQGWAWVIAAGLAMLAVAVQLALVAPSREALASIHAELHQAAPRPGGRTPADAGAALLTEEQRLAELQLRLSTSPDATAVVTRMAMLAQAQQIALTQGDYQQRPYPGTRVTQVQVIQPVKASYPQLRSYIESVLRAFPNASLDQIEVRRDNVAQAQPSARLRWSVWIMADTPASLPSAPAAKEAKP